jgi:hypothetical protein
MTDKKNQFKDRARRMIERWAEKRTESGRTRPSVESDYRRSAPHAIIEKDTNQIVEPQRSISVLDESDVLVIGGGPAAAPF